MVTVDGQGRSRARLRRFVRSIALLGGAGVVACSSGGNASDPLMDGGGDGSHADTFLNDDAPSPADDSSAAVDSSTGDDATDVDAATDEGASDAGASDADGSGDSIALTTEAGTCHVNDTTVAQPTVPCAAGMYCITADGGQPACTTSDDKPDAHVESCGLINCAYDQWCYCANVATSYCVCDFLIGGPLAPPDLPVG